jgi:hypothetical protein
MKRHQSIKINSINIQFSSAQRHYNFFFTLSLSLGSGVVGAGRRGVGTFLLANRRALTSLRAPSRPERSFKKKNKAQQL